MLDILGTILVWVLGVVALLGLSVLVVFLLRILLSMIAGLKEGR